jgi:hypothetical protein
MELRQNCEVCGRPDIVSLCDIVDGVKNNHHWCAQHVPADLAPVALPSVLTCEVCGQKATIHFTKVLGGVQREHHFCAEHADWDVGLTPEAPSISVADPAAPRRRLFVLIIALVLCLIAAIAFHLYTPSSYRLPRTVWGAATYIPPANWKGHKESDVTSTYEWEGPVDPMVGDQIWWFEPLTQPHAGMYEFATCLLRNGKVIDGELGFASAAATAPATTALPTTVPATRGNRH